MPRKPKTFQEDPQAVKTGKAKQKLQDDVIDAYEGGDDMPHNYAYWNLEFSRYGKVFDQWERQVDKTLEVYASSDANITNPTSKFNIFFSVVQTLIPAVFARVPRPDVSRRFKDNDPAARVASTLLERALEYELDQFGDYKSAMHNAVFDYLTAGRSTAWVRYEPHIKAKELGDPTDGDQVSEDIDEPQEEMISEQSPIDYVHWRELGYTASARTWEEVKAVWRQVYLGRTQLIERFGEEVGNKIPLDVVPDSKKQQINRLDTRDQNSSQACIYEVWCKETKTVYWISKSLGRIIDKKDDPLGLHGFFPCPEPLFFSKLTDSLLPNPLYRQIRDQCEACNILAERQRSLIEALKVRGVYNAEFPELQRLLSEGENNSLIPVRNWANLAQKNGLMGAIDLIDITPIANTLVSSFEAMEQMKNQVYDLSGVSDVMRGGGTDPSETATAQALKSVNGQNRLKTMQYAVATFAGDLLKLKAQMICNQYSDETILMNGGAALLSMQDQALLPQALQMLRNEPMRGFRIQVSADSLILMDEQQEKTDRMEFISAIGGYFSQAIPMVSQTPELMPLAIELLKFSATAFKAGKTVEGLLDQTADSFREQMEAQKGQPKQPPIEIQKLQMQLQADSQLEQVRQQAKAQEMQMQAQLKAQEMQAQLQSKEAEAKLKAQVELNKQEAQAQENQLRNQLEAQQNEREFQLQQEMDIKKLLIERNTKLMEIHAKSAGALSLEQLKQQYGDGSEDELRELHLANGGMPDPQTMAKMMDASLINTLQNHAPASTTPGDMQIMEMLKEFMRHFSAPKQLHRDQSGMVTGVSVIAEPPRVPAELANLSPSQQAIALAIAQMTDHARKPKSVVRAPDGNVIGVQ